MPTKRKTKQDALTLLGVGGESPDGIPVRYIDADGKHVCVYVSGMRPEDVCYESDPESGQAASVDVDLAKRALATVKGIVDDWRNWQAQVIDRHEHS